MGVPLDSIIPLRWIARRARGRPFVFFYHFFPFPMKPFEPRRAIKVPLNISFKKNTKNSQIRAVVIIVFFVQFCLHQNDHGAVVCRSTFLTSKLM